jgi:flagellum-specific peptidoglycan hydrolase FlgJ
LKQKNASKALKVQNISMERKNINENVKQAFPMVSKGMQQGYDFANQYNPDMAELLRRIFEKLMIPLVAFRAKLYRTFAWFFKLVGLNPNSKVPIFRVAVIIIGCLLIYQKDISFSFNMSNPFNRENVASEGEEDGYAKSVNEYAPVSAGALSREEAEAYIKQYAKIAQTEMEKYGIPASITLGQALVESRAGTSRLAVQNNNHFGVKCFSKSCKKGHCTNHKDDHHKDFFRKYESVWQSYRGHSECLQKERYKKLKTYGKDYKKWARGLREAGYATDKKYDKKLIGVIQHYNLDKYDK